MPRPLSLACMDGSASLPEPHFTLTVHIIYSLKGMPPVLPKAVRYLKFHSGYC